jgi:hypothetical protein
MASTLLEETRQAHDDIERLERYVWLPRMCLCTFRIATFDAAAPSLLPSSLRP